MFMRCLLVPTATGRDTTHRLDAALKLSKRLHAHVDVLFVSADAKSLLAALPPAAVGSGVTLEAIELEAAAIAAAGKTSLEAWCLAASVSTLASAERLDETFASWREEVGDLETIVALAGRVSDLIIIDRPSSNGPFSETIFDAAVFSTGRPTLMVPATLPYDLLSHVAIAWNGTLEAARVVGESIALLHEADRVSIIRAQGREGDETRLADLAGYLRWHGIVANELSVKVSADKTAGEAILEEVDRIDASMLLMGAYTHSRIRQFLLGGVTREVIAKARIPVLMTH